MNTMHFKYAAEVERTGSITQAAENLFIAQPNLSKAIKELEDSLDITIFERTSKGAVPTEQGSEFLEYAKRILIQLDKMESIYIPKNKRFDRQAMKLSIPRGSYISAGFSKFVKELDLSKEIDIHIQETNSMQTIINVTENNFTLGIIRYQNIYENYFLDYLKEKNLAYETLWEFKYLALMSADHVLADSPELDYHTLAESSIEIVHGDNVIPYLSVAEVKRPASDSTDYKNKKIYVYERGSQFDMLTQVPSTYMWVSPIPDNLIKRYNLIQRKCKMVNNSFKDLLIYSQGYKFTELEKKFINKLYEEKNEVSFAEYK